MHLALEALGVVQPRPTVVDELIDHLQLIEAEDALRASLEEMDALLYTYQSLESIHQAIKAHGVTQSIVYLYGENFSSMENDQTAGSEKEVEEKKQGVLKRIWTALKNLFERFCKWVKSLFTRAKSLKDQLEQVKKKAEKCKYPLEISGLVTSELMKEIVKHANTFDSFWRGSLPGRIQIHDEFLKRVEDAISTEHKEEFKTAQDVISRSNDLQDYLGKIPYYQEALEDYLGTPDELRARLKDATEEDAKDMIELVKHKILVCQKSMNAVTVSAQRLVSAIDKAPR